MWLNQEKVRLRSGCPQCGNVRVDGQECAGCKKPNQLPTVPTAKVKEQETPVLVDVSNLEKVEIPSLWRRGVATGIDILILWILHWAVVPYCFVMAISSETAFSNMVTVAGFALIVLWNSAIEWWLYAAVFESSPLMATPGKFAMGLIALDLKGRKLSFFQASKRILTVSFTLGLIAVGSIAVLFFRPDAKGLVWIVNLIMPACFLFAIGNEKRQTLFDYACGRLVLFRKSLPEAERRIHHAQLKDLKRVVAATLLFGLALNTVPLIEIGKSADLFFKLENALANEKTDPKALEIAKVNMEKHYPKISHVYSVLARIVKDWNQPLRLNYMSKAVRFARQDGETRMLPALLIDHARLVLPTDKNLAWAELDEANGIAEDQPALYSQVHEIKAGILASEENNSGAIKEMTLAIAENPVNAKLYEERARLLALSHDEAAVRLDNKRAEEVSQMKFDSLYDLRMADHKERLSALTKLTKIAPESISAKAYLVKTKYESLDYDPKLKKSTSSKEALKELERLSTAYPDNVVVQKTAAEIWEQEGQNQKAISCLTVLINFNPTAEAYSHRGDLYETLRNHKMAVRDYTQALGLTPDDPVSDVNAAFTYASRAISQAKLGKFQDAVDDYSEALALSPGGTTWLSNRANMYEMLGQWDKAVQDLDEAIDAEESEYTKADLQCARARMLMHMGKTQQALADCNATLETDSYNVEALYIRAKLYDRLGRKKDAKADREEIKSIDL